MHPRQRYLLGLIFILTSLILVFIYLRLHNRVQALGVIPEGGSAISIHGKLGITFNQLMKPVSVEAHFSIQPRIEGRFTWEGETVWFIPDEVLDPGQFYQVTLAAGAEAATGRKLRQPITWQVPVREPEMVYLRLDTHGGDLWRFDLTSGISTPLTNTEGNVIDFAVDHTGDWIAYAQVNTQDGSDLWRVDRQGSNPTLILTCNMDRCSQPAWSPDGIWIAYSREEYSADNALYNPARVWTLYTKTDESFPLYDRPDAFSHTPSFSPDGKRLATYSTLQNAIRILELETGQESVIPSVLLGVGDWSPDGKKLIYTNLVPSALEPNVGVFIADLRNQQVDHAFGEFISGTDFSEPRWSPDGKWVAYGARPVNGGISKGIYVINLEGGTPIPITDDPAATFVNYRWDPWGERLVFQRYPLSGPISHTSLWLWERSTGEVRTLVEKGARPEWLP